MSGPTLEVRNVTEQKHENSEQKLKFSGFHIVISTNKRPGTDEDSHALGGRLNKAIALTFTHEGLQQFIMFIGPNRGDNYKTNIKDIDVQYNIELGSKSTGGRIHSHVILKISHNSMIRLNIPMLRALLLKNLNIDGQQPEIVNIYLKIHMIRSDKGLEEYLLKKQVDVKDIGREVIDSGDTRVDTEALAKDMGAMGIA